MCASSFHSKINRKLMKIHVVSSPPIVVKGLMRPVTGVLEASGGWLLFLLWSRMYLLNLDVFFSFWAQWETRNSELGRFLWDHSEKRKWLYYQRYSLELYDSGLCVLLLIPYCTFLCVHCQGLRCLDPQDIHIPSWDVVDVMCYFRSKGMPLTSEGRNSLFRAENQNSSETGTFVFS